MIQTSILLTSADYIKSMTNISDNVNGKVLLTAIRESQDIDLQEIIGTNLLNKLKELVSSDEIQLDENAPYLHLLNECQYFLAYSSISKIIMMLSYKIDNMGVVTTNDENVQNVDFEDVYNLKEYYSRKADAFAFTLQLYILNHINELPEVDDCQCHNIKAHLYSSANPSIFLGGRRGKIFK